MIADLDTELRIERLERRVRDLTVAIEAQDKAWQRTIEEHIRRHTETLSVAAEQGERAEAAEMELKEALNRIAALEMLLDDVIGQKQKLEQELETTGDANHS